MLRDLLAERLSAAVSRLVESGALPPGDYKAEIVDPKSPEHGDFACNFALAYAKSAGLAPRELAQKLVDALDAPDLIEASDIAGPGFINFRLKPKAIAAMVPRILELGEGLPRTAYRAPSNESPSAFDLRPSTLRLNVEFVSVNPNGPITVGSGRGADYGSTLCNILEAVGHEVHREYYINDGTNSEQMRLFAESVRAIAKGEPVPENGYKGDYIEAIAHRLFDNFGREKVLAKARNENSVSWFQHESEQLMLAAQGVDLTSFGVTFDTWFSEQSLYESGFAAKCIKDLVTKGAADEEPYQLEIVRKRSGEIEIKRNEQPVEEEDIHGADPHPPTPSPFSPGGEKGEGAFRTLWLRSTKFGDDKDRVLRRKDGRWTYIASDVAYHKSKFERGTPPNGKVEPADKLITILGPDHHGYIGRLRAVVAALLEKVEGRGTKDEGKGTKGRRDKGTSGFKNPKSKIENPKSSRPSNFDLRPLSDSEKQIYRSVEERDACLAALEEANKRLDVIIFQIVRFLKDGKPAPMRKRDGNIYSLRDLMLEIGRNAAPNAPEEEQLRIGKDVARFFYLMRSHDTHMDFDLDLAEKQSEENPVYYVQYAHARICSVLRKAEEQGFPSPQRASRADPLPRGEGSGFDASLLAHPKELELIKKICDLPFEVRRCAEDQGVHRLTTYALDLARAFHLFYDSCRVIQPENPKLMRARLALCVAARIGLKSTFDLLEISAPERMEREPVPA